MQTDLVHHLIHNEGGTGKIARVLHKRDKEVEYHNIRQEYNHATHTSDYAVANHIFQYTIGQPTLEQPSDKRHTLLNPLLWIGPEAECAVEHQPHHKDKDRVGQHAMRNHSIYGIGYIAEFILTLGVCFAQGTHNEAILLVGHCGLDILVGTKVVFEVLSLLVTDALPHLVSLALALEHRLNIGITLEHLHRKVARCKALWKLVAMLLHILVERHHALLGNTLIDVDMAHTLITVLIYGNYRIEQLLDTLAAMPLDRYHRHAQHLTKRIVVERGVVALQFVIHTQCNNHTLTHIDKLGGEIEVALEIGCANDIQHHIGRMRHQMTTHI